MRPKCETDDKTETDGKILSPSLSNYKFVQIILWQLQTTDIAFDRFSRDCEHFVPQ